MLIRWRDAEIALEELVSYELIGRRIQRKGFLGLFIFVRRIQLAVLEVRQVTSQTFIDGIEEALYVKLRRLLFAIQFWRKELDLEGS